MDDEVKSHHHDPPVDVINYFDELKHFGDFADIFPFIGENASVFEVARMISCVT
jgi:hypothetical protein